MASNPKADSKRTETETEEDCKMMVEPNMMAYQDKDGVEHKIYLPKGTFKAAAEHFEAGNFDELAKFPAWENQQYTPEDDIRKK
ncbi:Fc.00g081160.m01.CDS01 [Cosmosporella sp. VM-42]